jgi:hypothetical protein
MSGRHDLSRRNCSPIRPLLFVLCFFGCSTATMAQERYSANSLIAAFDKYSKASPKGTSITLADVVVESKKTKIVFKSSTNDKVICELASPLAEDNGILSGTILTVIGKVRGRGMLGNVTLDDCSLKKNEVVAEAAPVAAPEPLPVPVEVAPAPLATPVVPPVVAKATPAPVTVAAPSVSPRKPVSATPPVEMAKAVEVPDHDEGLMPKNLQLPLDMPEEPTQPVEEVSTSRRSSLVLFCSVGGFLLGVLIMSVVKRRAASGEPDNPVMPGTPETRRVALQALLARQKK